MKKNPLQEAASKRPNRAIESDALGAIVGSARGHIPIGLNDPPDDPPTNP